MLHGTAKTKDHILYYHIFMKCLEFQNKEVFIGNEMDEWLSDDGWGAENGE